MWPLLVIINPLRSKLFLSVPSYWSELIFHKISTFRFQYQPLRNRSLGKTQHKVFLYNKTNQMHQFPKFTSAWNSTCFGQFLCPSSGVYSLYTRHWYKSYRFVDSFREVPGGNILALLESCLQTRKFGKLVHLVGFITKKFVTMHGHMNVNCSIK